MKVNIGIGVKILLLCVLFLTGITYVNATANDFRIENNTSISYTTGSDYVSVRTEYVREVKNSKYYYSTDGEKVFHIPDLPKSKDYEIELERQYKVDSLKVTDGAGRSVKYSIEKLALGEGIYVKVPNYKQTTYGSPYRVITEYKTHDLVKKILDYVVIQAPSLHQETQFEQVDSSSGTKTELLYSLTIVTDKDISALTKVFPDKYSKVDGRDTTSYTFSSADRIGQSPYLEFGTKQAYRFELKYKTPKTDNFVPEKYSSKLNALSTNIYEMSLPRDFSETNQRVKIDEIYPIPSKIFQDSEGNILARFEIPANKGSEIFVSGYVWVEQNSYESKRLIPDMVFSEYLHLVSGDRNLRQYLLPSKFWEIGDAYIRQEAEKLMEGKSTLMDIVRSDYRYVNDRLEYDDSKANSDNGRIGAKAALQGGGAVCMEYADSMIALLRAQGIPSRAALGYSNLTSTKVDTGNTRHQWVQIWIPEYGWLSIDPTYESNNMLIGQNIEKILWETFYGEELSSIKIYSADRVSSDDFADYVVNIYAVNEDSIPISSLLEYSDIRGVQEESETLVDVLNTFIKTTALGKSIIILLPVAVLVATLIALLILGTGFLRRVRTRIASRD